MITISTQDDIATIINTAQPSTVIELLSGTHYLTDDLKPPSGVFAFARDRSKTAIACKTDSMHQIMGNADAVTFANVTFTGYDSRLHDRYIHSNSKWQKAFINPNGDFGTGWQFLNCDFTNIYPRALNIAPNMRVYDCLFSGMGVLGLGFNSATNGVIVDHCEFTNNNTSGDGVEPREEGAMKLGSAQGLTIRNCYVHDDTGGIWIDVETHQETHNVRITDNIVVNVKRPGIHYEISHDGIITGNHVKGCGWGKNNWGWGSQILISSSMDTYVYNNVCDARGDGDKWGNGITVIHQDRFPGAHDNMVKLNDIINAEKSVSGVFDDTDGKTNSNNIFYKNRNYKYGDDIPEGLDTIPEWKRYNDFVPPDGECPPVTQPPIEIPAGTTFKLDGMITVIKDS